MKIEITEGVVTNEGAELGIIQDGICHLTLPCAGPIKGEIRKVASNPDLKFLVGEAPDTEGDEAVQTPAAPVASNPADPMPPRDLINGDKCPHLIAWKARQPKKGGK